MEKNVHWVRYYGLAYRLLIQAGYVETSRVSTEDMVWVKMELTEKVNEDGFVH